MLVERDRERVRERRERTERETEKRKSGRSDERREKETCTAKYLLFVHFSKCLTNFKIITCYFLCLLKALVCNKDRKYH